MQQCLPLPAPKLSLVAIPKATSVACIRTRFPQAPNTLLGVLSPVPSSRQPAPKLASLLYPIHCFGTQMCAPAIAIPVQTHVPTTAASETCRTIRTRRPFHNPHHSLNYCYSISPLHHFSLAFLLVRSRLSPLLQHHSYCYHPIHSFISYVLPF